MVFIFSASLSPSFLKSIFTLQFCYMVALNVKLQAVHGKKASIGFLLLFCPSGQGIRKNETKVELWTLESWEIMKK